VSFALGGCAMDFEDSEMAMADALMMAIASKLSQSIPK